MPHPLKPLNISWVVFFLSTMFFNHVVPVLQVVHTKLWTTFLFFPQIFASFSHFFLCIFPEHSQLFHCTFATHTNCDVCHNIHRRLLHFTLKNSSNASLCTQFFGCFVAYIASKTTFHSISLLFMCCHCIAVMYMFRRYFPSPSLRLCFYVCISQPRVITFNVFCLFLVF